MPAWVVPPGSAIRLAFGYRLRTYKLPSYGVAASSVSSIISTLLVFVPLMVTGVWAFAGQNRHGALNQALSQVSNGDFW